MQFAFVGGTYQNQSLRADAQSTINLYPETDRTGNGKSKVQLVGTPGLQPFITLPTSPIRGIWIGENRLFAVAGSKLYEVFQNATYNSRGDVGVDTANSPVQIFPNGNQLGIVSAGQFYCDNGAGPVAPSWPAATGTMTVASSPSSNLGQWVSGDLFDNSMVGKTLTFNGAAVGTIIQVSNPRLLMVSSTMSWSIGPFSIPGGNITASSGTFQDGYAIVSVPSSAQFNISALYDFSTWNPIDFALKEGYPDHLSAVIADHTNLYLLGKQTVEIWRNVGDADFPFQRIPGEVLQIGCIATNSPDRLLDGIAFLGTDSRGGPTAILLQGYQWQRISTPPLEAAWAKYSTVSDAVSFSYRDGGHLFWVLSFPSGNATWCYDAVEQQWHQRGYWTGTVLNRTLQYLHGYVWGGYYAGDYSSGKIYTMSRDYYTDAGQAIQRQRVAAHLSDENRQYFFSRFTLDIQTGEVANPAFTLDWSKDGGNTYGLQYTINGGPASTYNTRMIWRRLGATRSRTFRVTSTAPMRHVWIDGYVDVTAGNN